jgi:hypothetical protein
MGIKSGLGINQKKCPHLILEKENLLISLHLLHPLHLLLRFLHLLKLHHLLIYPGGVGGVNHIFGA